MSSQDNVIVSNYLGVHRLQSYLNAIHGNLDLALELYKWKTSVSSAMFHVLGDVEVVVRNAVDVEMQSLNVTLDNQGDWFASAPRTHSQSRYCAGFPDMH